MRREERKRRKKYWNGDTHSKTRTCGGTITRGIVTLETGKYRLGGSVENSFDRRWPSANRTSLAPRANQAENGERSPDRGRRARTEAVVWGWIE